MISCRDPSQMTAEDRLAELAEALAIGYLRLLAKRKNPLDQRPESEAPCALVNGVEITPGKEPT